jgi:hypothetical protein
MTVKQKIVGSSEIVGFPIFDLFDVPAKIDTGADSGAIHCTKIVEKVIKGKNVIQFSPFDHPDTVIVATDFTMKIVRSSNGDASKRYFIDTTIQIQNKEYPIHLSLADRTEMTWPVLIGKRFLTEQHFLVDVSKEAAVLLADKALES